MSERINNIVEDIKEQYLEDDNNVTILFSALTRMFPKPTFAP